MTPPTIWMKSPMRTLAALSLALALAINTAAAASNPELHSAAAKGDASAQFQLGVMYANGVDVPEDDTEAVRWYRLAAEQGLAEAQNNLGLMYANGVGVTQDDAEAVRWYRLAAEQGLARAQFLLGTMYDTGEGVPEDIVEAYAWLNIAAAQRDELAKDYKARISRRMSRSQIAEAQKRSREYWTRYVVPFQ